MGFAKRLSIFLLVIVVLALVSFYKPNLTGDIINREEYQKEPATVIKVIDGDTIRTDLGEIRLLGVNTPEKSQPYYREATEFLKIIENQSVELLRDKEDTDKYERKLRYVFYNDRLLNVEILENGLATSFMLDDLDARYKSKLSDAEKFAIKNKVGLWQESSDKCAKCIALVSLDPVEEYFIIINNCSFECPMNKWIVKDDANHFFKLNMMYPKQARKFESNTSVWNDEGDRFFMRDSEGKLVVFYEY